MKRPHFRPGLFPLLFTPTLLLLAIIGFTACGSADNGGSRAYQTTIEETTRYIREQMALFDVVGLSIALVDEKGVVWANGFGLANIETGAEVNADTAFMLGSGTKTLTTAALLRARDQGLLVLDQPVHEYLPEFSLIERYADQANQITVRRILNHHSGIPGDVYNGGFINFDPFSLWGCDLYTDWLFDYLAADYPSHQPGAVTSYCNTGFVLAGEIAQRLLGRPGEDFTAFMKREVFDRLAMARTSLAPITENRATGYVNGQAYESMQGNCVFGATGGAYTTVKDMGRFLAMLLNEGKSLEGERYLQSETVAMMGQAEITPLDIHSYLIPGLGLDSMDDPVMRYAGRAWVKAGSTGDFHSFMGLLPDRGLACIVMTNCDEGGLLTYGLLRKCLQEAVQEKDGLKPSPPELPRYVTDTEPAAIAGLYAKAGGYDLVADNGDGTYTWSVNAHTDSPTARQLFYRDEAYMYGDNPERVVFKKLSYQGLDYQVMIQASGSGSLPDLYLVDNYMQQILGQKVDIREIPPAWADRVGLYAIANAPWNQIFWPQNAAFVALEEKDGVLLFDDKVAVAEDDSLAFLASIDNRADGCLRITEKEGVERIVTGGLEVLPVGAIPPLAVGETAIGRAGVYRNQWYAFQAEAPGAPITAEVLSEQADYYLIVYDRDLQFVTRAPGSVTIDVPGDGAYYLAVAATPDASGSFSLRLTQ